MLKLKALRSKRKPPKFNLVTASQNLITFLEQVDRYPCLYLNKPILRNAIRRYEHIWPRVVAFVPPDNRILLAPPLDVEWVWFLHMLCPFEYCTDSAAMCAAANPGKQPFVLDHFLLSGATRAEALRRAEKIWKKVVPNEPFHVLDLLTRSPLRDNSDSIAGTSKTEESLYIGSDIFEAAARQMTFLYQVSLPHYRDKSFLNTAVDRYKKQFLRLHRLFPEEIWAPPLDIDLVWHAHMAHPSQYSSDTKILVGRLLSNDALNDRSSRFQPDACWQKTDIKWQEIFGQSIGLPGYMWRGDVSPEERIARPSIQSAIRDLETLLEGYQRNIGSNTNMKIAVRVDVDQTAFSSMSKFDRWVHNSLYNAGVQSFPKDGEHNDAAWVERWSRCGASPLFVNRARHALMHDNEGVPLDYCSVLEVFRGGTDVRDLGFPIATAHTPPPMSTPSYRKHMHIDLEGPKISSEKLLVLRIGGEDFAIMSCVWVFPFCSEETLAIPEQGYVSIHIMYVGSGSSNVWIPLLRSQVPFTANGPSPNPYLYHLPSPSRADCIIGSFDLLKGTVTASNAKQMLPNYLVFMSAAMLFVNLQPWHRSMNTVETLQPIIIPTHREYGALGAVGGREIQKSIWAVIGDGEEEDAWNARRLAQEAMVVITLTALEQSITIFEIIMAVVQLAAGG